MHSPSIVIVSSVSKVINEEKCVPVLEYLSSRPEKHLSGNTLTLRSLVYPKQYFQVKQVANILEVDVS